MEPKITRLRTLIGICNCDGLLKGSFQLSHSHRQIRVRQTSRQSSVLFDDCFCNQFNRARHDPEYREVQREVGNRVTSWPNERGGCLAQRELIQTTVIERALCPQHNTYFDSSKTVVKRIKQLVEVKGEGSERFDEHFNFECPDCSFAKRKEESQKAQGVGTEENGDAMEGKASTSVPATAPNQFALKRSRGNKANWNFKPHWNNQFNQLVHHKYCEPCQKTYMKEDDKTFEYKKQDALAESDRLDVLRTCLANKEIELEKKGVELVEKEKALQDLERAAKCYPGMRFRAYRLGDEIDRMRKDLEMVTGMSSEELMEMNLSPRIVTRQLVEVYQPIEKARNILACLLEKKGSVKEKVDRDSLRVIVELFDKVEGRVCAFSEADDKRRPLRKSAIVGSFRNT